MAGLRAIRRLRAGLFATFTVLLLPAPLAAQSAPRTTTDLLTFIRALEAPGGYDDYERRIATPPPRRLTAMTVREVLDWQRRAAAAGAVSTAAGGYQIIRPTLARLLREHRIDPRARFDAAMQDRLARLLIAECGGAGARAHHGRFGNCLAGIWAALPLTEGPRRGRSAYEGIAGNRALTSPRTLLALIAGRRVPLGPSAARGRPHGADEGHQVLAFGASRIVTDIRRVEIAAALRKAGRDGTLTPSIRIWRTDPYAQD